MSKEVPLTKTLDVIPLTLKPSSFPQDVVEMWRLRVDEYLVSPLDAVEGDLLGVDITNMLVSPFGYPASEVHALFCLRGGVCDGQIEAFSERGLDKCLDIIAAFRSSIDIGLNSMLFGHLDWVSRQLHTLVFRDFTLLYDGFMIQEDRDFSSKMKLILHAEAAERSPAQLKRDIELCLNGFAKARNGLDRVRFTVDLKT